MPEIVQGEKLSDFLEQVLIESREDLEVLYQDFHSLGSVLTV